MNFSAAEKFTFVSSGFPGETFGVVEYRGTEGLSQCYRFEITLVSDDEVIDIGRVLDYTATLTILREDGDPVRYQGMPIEFGLMHSAQGHTFYQAVLAPKLWYLTQTQDNQVFLNLTVPEILESVLKDGGLTTLDYELRLQGEYPKQWEFVCMYRESHFDFLCRWMEREGIYFYFEQHEAGEKLIITDTKIAHIDLPEKGTLVYSQSSGLDSRHTEEVVRSLVCRQKKLTKNIRLHDYNYRRPSLEVSGRADVSQGGWGDVFIYGENFQSVEEGDHLASIRAQELQCREKLFICQSSVPFVQSGYTFDLSDHYRSDFNRKYLTIEVEHRGSQISYLTAGLKETLPDREQAPLYENDFTAIPAEVQFRPKRQTEKPRIYGTMNAHIDSAGSGRYAELDEQGRYKVILPFDVSGRKDGHASAWLRMAQPYAGANHGMHFPLHKGTEVLLTFIDGDPDRPIISAAVPNPEYPSPVHAGNVTRAGFKTAGGGSLHFENMEGKERIVMHSGDGRSHFSLGKGSPSESVIASDHNVQFSALASNQLAGIVHTMCTFDSCVNVTGFKRAQLTATAIEGLISALPELAQAAAIARKESEGDSPKEAVESDAAKMTAGICTMAAPILTLLSELKYLDYIGDQVEKYFKSTDKLRMDLADDPAYFTGSLEQGAITQLDRSGKHIVLGTSRGDFHAYASDDMVSTAKNIEINATDAINAETSTGTIKLNCESKTTDLIKTDTTFTLTKGDAQFLSKHKNGAYQTKILCQHNDKGPLHTSETKGKIGTTNHTISYTDSGPSMTTSISDGTGSIDFTAGYTADGPEAILEVKKDDDNIANVKVGYDSGLSGMKSSIEAGKVFDLSGETISIASKRGEATKASLELKTDGTLLINGAKKVTLKSKNGNGNVFYLGNRVDAKNLKIKK